MKLNRKNKFLIAGFAGLLYICYAFAISKTITYYKQYKDAENIIVGNIDQPQLLQKLVAKEKQLNTLLEQYNTGKESIFQNQLLQELTKLVQKYRLRIVDFKEPHTFNQNGQLINSYIFTVEGSFNGILLLINSIENNASLGYVKHTSFIKKKNYKTNQDYLTCEVILQTQQASKN